MALPRRKLNASVTLPTTTLETPSVRLTTAPDILMSGASAFKLWVRGYFSEGYRNNLRPGSAVGLGATGVWTPVSGIR